MEHYIADYRHADLVARFFAKHIHASNEGITNLEFLCPDGAKAACRRREVVIAVEEQKLVGALRFYRRKTGNTVSLYQYAIREDYRGNGILTHMLSCIDTQYIEVSCSSESIFNSYYEKTGWNMVRENRGMFIWQFCLT